MSNNSDNKIEVPFNLYGSLPALISGEWRNPACVTIPSHSSMKDTVQSLGIPHTEVALVVVNATPAEWNHHFACGESVHLYGQDSTDKIGFVFRVDSPPPHPPRFLLDVHLGRLAAYLRLLGYDTLYDKRDPGDEALVEISVAENRILLTCDHGLLNRNAVRHGYLIRSRDSVEQTLEVVERYGLRAGAKPFSRCLNCNTLLEPASVEKIKNEAPSKVVRNHGYDPLNYLSCVSCGKLFWHGTHTERMKALLERWGIDYPGRAG